MKRKIVLNVFRRDCYKMQRSRDFFWRGEIEGKEYDYGVMVCVVIGIFGWFVVRVYCDDKFVIRFKRSKREYLGEVKEVLKDGKEMEVDVVVKDVFKGLYFFCGRSKERSCGFVFGVFGILENFVLEEDKSIRVDVNELNLESGVFSCDMENVDVYSNCFLMFFGMDL